MLFLRYRGLWMPASVFSMWRWWRDAYHNKKHLKTVGPIRNCEPPHAAYFTLPFTRCRYCRTPPAHRCPQQHRQQRQRVTEGTAMAPWNGPKERSRWDDPADRNPSADSSAVHSDAEDGWRRWRQRRASRTRGGNVVTWDAAPNRAPAPAAAAGAAAAVTRLARRQQSWRCDEIKSR